MILEHRRQKASMRFSVLFFVFSGFYFGLLGALEVSSRNPVHQKRHFSNSYSPGQLVSIQIRKKISENPGRIRFAARVVSVEDRLTRGKVFVSVPSFVQGRPIGFGDTLVTKRALKKISPLSNPGGFDFKAYAAKQNVHHQVYLSEGDFVRRVGGNNGIHGISVRINERLQQALERILTSPQALAVAKALLLGYRLEISQDLLDEYKGAGAMHILAISGLHVGIVLMILMRLTRPMRSLPFGRQLQLLLAVLALWCFGLITGMTVSVVRAVSMFSLLALGKMLNRNTRLIDNLVISAFFLLLFNPMYLFDVGFQLSYSALFGIASFAPFQAKFKRRGWKIINYFRGLILMSCAAQAGVMPLTLLYFNQFSGLFLVSSLVLIPVIGATLTMGYSLTFLALVTEPPRILSHLFQRWMELLNAAVEFIGGVEVMIFRDVYFPLHFSILTFLALAVLIFGLTRNKVLPVYCFGILIVFMQLIWLKERSVVVQKEELVVFQLWKDSLILKRWGIHLFASTSLKDSAKRQRALRNYSRRFPGSFTLTEPGEASRGLRRIFSVDSTVIFLLDSSVVWNEPELKPQVLVLAGSPRLNLARILKKMNPKVIVADGSNYPSFVERWKQTCAANGVKFHSTAEKGAFTYPGFE
jgi:competence protein ComEC